MMRHFSICARCKLHTRWQIHLRSLQQSRRGFFQATSIGQDRSVVDILTDIPKTDNGEASPRLKRRSPATERRPGLDSSRHQRGRYSGKELQEILGAIDGLEGSDGGVKEEELRLPRLSRRHQQRAMKFIELYKDIKWSEDLSPAVKAWDELQQISREVEADEALRKGFGSYIAFQKSFSNFVVGLSRNAVLPPLHGSGVIEKLPKPSEVLGLLPVLRLGFVDNVWPQILWLLASGLVERPFVPSTELTQQHRAEMLHELMVIWNMAMVTRFVKDPRRRTVNGANLDWSFLPSPKFLLAQLNQAGARGSKHQFDDMLRMLLPPITERIDISGDTRANILDYTSPALICVDLLRLQRTDGISRPSQSSYDPFLELIEAMLKSRSSPPPIPRAIQDKLGMKPRIAAYKGYKEIVQRLSLRGSEALDKDSQAITPEAVTKEVSSNIQDARNCSEPPPNPRLLEEETDVDGLPPAAGPGLESGIQDEELRKFYIEKNREMGLALAHRNAMQLEGIKEQIFEYANHPLESQFPDQFYQFLMYAFPQLHRPQSAIDVWNHFIRVGRQPTAKTYTLMMRGALQVRDVKGMEVFWTKMRDAKVQPDVYAWCVRIFGLLRTNRTHEGMSAVGEMSQEWIAAAQAQLAKEERAKALRGKVPRGKAAPKLSTAEIVRQVHGSVNGVPRPNLALMNAIIAALAATNNPLSKSDLIPKTLAWGRHLGLEPDGKTYNMLLNLSMRHGLIDEAMAILKRMQERDIETDSTTWTILLSALFAGHSLDGLSPAEVQNRLLTYIDSLESATGTKINKKGYALIIDRLLKQHNNPTAASAMLSHMVQKGFQPTTQIYTILMTAYFQREPEPDFAAAAALWAHIEASDFGRGAALDSVFYDRMIEGYARHHRTVGTQPMLRFLDRAMAEGRQPSWPALELVARALAERDEWGRLMKLVESVRGWIKFRGGEMMVGPRTFGQWSFWDFILKTQLFRREGIKNPYEFMKRKVGLSPIEDMVRRGERGGVQDEK